MEIAPIMVCLLPTYVMFMAVDVNLSQLLPKPIVINVTIGRIPSVKIRGRNVSSIR